MMTESVVEQQPPAADNLTSGPQLELTPEDLAELQARVEQLVTEDDTPVDNIFSEKQQRLLTEPLYTSWAGSGERTFLAAANVGVFYAVSQPPLVPDMFLSLDAQVAQEVWEKRHRSYLIWEFGKPPEVAIEIVSNLKGHEAGRKRRVYAQIGVWYYVIFDPAEQLKGGTLHVYELQKGTYVPRSDGWFAEIGLGLTLWRGTYEGLNLDWLRWCDQDGVVIPTGAERAEQERARAEQAAQQAEQERARAERLAAQLRALGIAPEE